MRRKSTIYIACDKFKGTLSAVEATTVIGSEIAKLNLEADVRFMPMADGGEGTSAIVGAAYNCRPITFEGQNCLGERIEITAMVDDIGRRAFIDSSAVVGILRCSRPDPWLASTFPLGLALKHLATQGYTSLTVGIGGTATIDGGAGLLQALGARYFNSRGQIITELASLSTLNDIAMADFSAVDFNLWRECLRGLSDVACPLVSFLGVSALSFAQQKGVDPSMIDSVAAALKRWRLVATTSARGGDDRFNGAGGGIGFALGEILGAKMELGAEYVTRLHGMWQAPLPDLVITGEGRFDDQSTAGKVTGTIIAGCQRASIPVVVIAGHADITHPYATVISADTYLPGAPLTPSLAIDRLRIAATRLSQAQYT